MDNIKMPAAIKKITLTTATFKGDVVEPTFINFFYGRNGAGKSTIAKAIQNNIGIEWQSDVSADNYDVLVYNQDFINENFRNYGDVAGVFTFCKENIDIQNQIEEKKIKLNETENKITALNFKMNSKEELKSSLMSELQENCWDKTHEIRTDFKEAIKGIGTKKSLVSTILDVNTPVKHDIAELKNICNIAYSTDARIYSLFSKADNLLNYEKMPGKNLLDKIVVSRSNTTFANFIKRLGASDWVRKGHEQYAHIADGKCPFCQQELPMNFEKEIEACFDNQYQQDIRDLSEFKLAYEKETSSILQKLRANLLNTMHSLDLSKYNDKIALLENSITINVQNITEKLKEPTKIIVLNDTAPLLIEINALIDEINSKIETNNKIARDKGSKKECEKMLKEHIAFLLSYDTTSYKNKLSKLNTEINTLVQEINLNRKETNVLRQNISDLNKQTVNTKTAIDNINTILTNSGFQGFYIREKTNTENVYEVIRRDDAGNEEVAANLSEGERNFIAFLYFFQLVRGSHSSDNTKEKIIVIDDPVSSMDSGALFIVGSLVREMTDVCYNNTSYDGNTDLGDYIKQIFILTHNVYFHHDVTYKRIKNYRNTSLYIIHKVNNISSVQLCVRHNPYSAVPSDKENYNPVQNSYKSLWSELKNLNSSIPALNVIRQILEYYFMQMCGYDRQNLRKEILDTNKELFITPAVDGNKPDYTKYHLASAMLEYISNSPGISDGLHYVEDTDDVQKYKDVFALIFKALNQEQHYNMMMDTQI